MKKGLFRWMAVAVLGLALPFFLGLNCCCFAETFSKPACHPEATAKNCQDNTSSHSPKKDSAATCRCATQTVLRDDNSARVANLASLAFQNLIFFDATSNLFEIQIHKQIVAFDDASPPLHTKSIYLSFFHAHAPPRV